MHSTVASHSTALLLTVAIPVIPVTAHIFCCAKMLGSSFAPLRNPVAFCCCDKEAFSRLTLPAFVQTRTLVGGVNVIRGR